MYKSLEILRISTCKSTQEEARLGLVKIKVPKNKIFTVMSRHQTAGRGRQGHRWIDKNTESLLMSASFLWPKNKSVPSQITLLAGFSLWKALQKFKNDPRLAIKWPNDIVGLKNGQVKKLGGILCEARSNIITIGWGLNLNGRAPLKKSGTLKEFYLNSCPSLESLSQVLIKEFTRNLNSSFKKDYWLKLHTQLKTKAMKALWGKKLLYLKKHHGVAVNLDSQGALLLRKSDKKIHLIL